MEQIRGRDTHTLGHVAAKPTITGGSVHRDLVVRAQGGDHDAFSQASRKPDALTIMQFNGAVSGQTVYHLHFHIIPRWEGQPVGRHASGEMADAGELEALAERIAAMIS